MGKKWLLTKLSGAEIVHFFGAWHPGGNISLSELEQPEPDEPGDGAISYLNDDCDDDIRLFATQSAKMQAEASRRSIQGPLGIEKISLMRTDPRRKKNLNFCCRML